MAICINCGAVKSRPEKRCKVCHFQPSFPEDKAKSLILSTNYEIEGEYRWQSKEALLAVAPLVRTKVFMFDPAEVEQVAAYGEAVTSVPASVLLLELARWLGPPLLMLIAALVIMWFAK